ncbi:inorganic diphosphatase [Kitasatospora sp. NPDC098663]|uniref:inorganic diphosphatase n=1 Tax=Kitasatospora sp. NPDC098663 TaxID=3364096 RepID=UPI00382464CA
MPSTSTSTVVVVEATTCSAFTHAPRPERAAARWTDLPLLGCPVGEGYISDTLDDDGHAARALVLLPDDARPGRPVNARPVALLRAEREGQPAEETVCVDADDHDFDQITGPDDLAAWHAGPDALAQVWDHLTHHATTRQATSDGPFAARAHLDHTRHAYQRLTGCLDWA